MVLVMSLGEREHGDTPITTKLAIEGTNAELILQGEGTPFEV